MKIEAIEMTTPLNVEMLKELRCTLEALTAERALDEQGIQRPCSSQLQMLEVERQAATEAVMRAIRSFCTPMVICSESAENTKARDRREENSTEGKDV